VITRLLVADDHSILRKGLKQFFEMEADILVAGEATNGDEVLHLVSEQEFDLLLLDMTMDGVSGADLIRRVKAVKPALPILVLSMHKVSQVALLALKAGADGYITKDSEPESLLAAIRKVAGGSKYIAPILSEEIAYNAMFSEPTLPHGSLSSREFEVFRLLVAGRGINEIAQQLFLSNKTVSTYKTRIMEKMNLHNMADLVRYAVQHDIAE
jgi:DNA-binding NarL/FixJ family response regulator